MPRSVSVIRFPTVCLVLAALGAPAAVARESAIVPVLFPDADAHAPRPLPDRIVLSWTGDPATSQTVTWRTNVSVMVAMAELLPATEHPLGGSPLLFDAVTQRLDSDLGAALYHTAEMNGLLPDTLYAYRVGDGANWSEWFQFQTASREARPFSFIYIGDAQIDIKSHWSRVFREAFRESPRAAFTLHAGDLINNANNDAQWGEWIGAPAWVNGSVPVIAAPGNHEFFWEGEEASRVRKLSHHWRAVFAFPTNGPAGLEETCYYFDYQGTRIVVLNSTEQKEDQVEWLRGILRGNPMRWTILAFHHPVFFPSKSRAEADLADPNKLRLLWKPVIDEFKVDLVLTGHDHVYARSGITNVPTGYPAQQDVENGTVYVVSVSGPKMYETGATPWAVRTAEDTQLFQVITIDGDELRYVARTATGRVHDGFVSLRVGSLPRVGNRSTLPTGRVSA
jgi:3',5'-cyclic AMP phosphodiesterase CpdA